LAFVFPFTPSIVIEEAFRKVWGAVVVMTIGETPAPVVIAMVKRSPHAVFKALWIAAVSSMTPFPLAPKSLIETARVGILAAGRIEAEAAMMNR